MNGSSNEAINTLEKSSVSRKFTNLNKVSERTVRIVHSSEDEANENESEKVIFQKKSKDKKEIVEIKASKYIDKESCYQLDTNVKPGGEQFDAHENPSFTRERRDSTASISSHSSLLLLMKRIDRLKNNLETSIDSNTNPNLLMNSRESMHLENYEMTPQKDKDVDGKGAENGNKTKNCFPQDMIGTSLPEENKELQKEISSDLSNKGDKDVLCNKSIATQNHNAQRDSNQKWIETGKLLCSKPNSIGYELSNRGRKLNKNEGTNKTPNMVEKATVSEKSIEQDSNSSLTSNHLDEHLRTTKNWSNVNFIKRTLDKLGFHRREAVPDKEGKTNAKRKITNAEILNPSPKLRDIEIGTNIISNSEKIVQSHSPRSESISSDLQRHRNRSSSRSSTNWRKRRFSSSDSSAMDRRTHSSISSYSGRYHISKTSASVYNYLNSKDF